MKENNEVLLGYEALCLVGDILGLPKELRYFHISLEIPIDGVASFTIKCRATEEKIREVLGVIKEPQISFESEHK